MTSFSPRLCDISALALAPLLGVACGLTRKHEASPAEAAESFEPFASRTIGGEGIESFLRRRTALLIGGPTTLRIETDDGRLSDRTRYVGDGRGGQNAAVGAAAAVSADGYFLTVAHALAAGPAQLAIEAHGGIECAEARVVWSDGARDIALVHSDLRPEAWFEIEPLRGLAAGEIVLAFSHFAGPASGALEVEVPFDVIAASATLEIPHDAPLRRGHSGGPAATLDGRLLGVQTSTGMDTIFLRRSWFAWVRPEELARLIAEDRAANP